MTNNPAEAVEAPAKQTTRMIKVVCADATDEIAGYTLRMTRKWIEAVGTPTCPCHGSQMVEATA